MTLNKTIPEETMNNMATGTNKAQHYLKHLFRCVKAVCFPGKLTNQKTYSLSNVVDLAAKESELQRPEIAILNLLKSKLPEMRMLDIGVGGGRTTVHFLNLVKEYIGTDYSANMIEACRKRFTDRARNRTFQVCDARSMDVFKDHYFDFVLFSFNGIDYVSHEDRFKIFTEVRRLGKPGGYFCFSSHNIHSKNIVQAFDIKLSRLLNPIALVRYLLLRNVYNRSVDFSELQKSPYAILNDGVLEFGLKTYHVDPVEQIRQLESYFSNIRIFSLRDGKEIINQGQLKANDDPWLYYLCLIK